MSVYDVCVIGSGPAGLVMSLELAKSGLSVLLVESGSEQYDINAQSLSDAKIINSVSHSVMKDAVWRGLGGTSLLWGGRCVPFDDIDYEVRDYVADSGWPISEIDLAEYFQLASEYCSINSPNFKVEKCHNLKTKFNDLAENLKDSEFILSTSLERWSVAPKMWAKLKNQLVSNQKLKVLEQHTCIGFFQNELGGRVSHALLKPTSQPDSEKLKIEASVFVIACGGVESTRLILNSMDEPNGLKLLGAKYVGLNYMGHLSGKIAEIQLYGNPKQSIYGFERDGEVYVRRRITLSNQLLKNQKLLNIAFWLDNPPISDWKHGSGILSAAYLGLTMPFVKNLLAPPAIRKRVAGDKLENLLKHLLNCLFSPIATATFVIKFLWSRYFANPPIPGFFTYSKNNRYSLHFHAEQTPNLNSKITLTDERDVTGLRRAKIDLQWSKQDVDSVIKAHSVLDYQLTSQGAGQLIYRHDKEALEQAVIDQSIDGFHQLGTLRMANDSSKGVTNSYGLLYGVTNTFVASSAIFPTSGQANPTFLIVANTIRQARHIAKNLRVSV